ncbi:hypothetical protein LINPERPRIM_LOCUS38779 [Linum perenne]
MTRSYSGRSE